MFIMTKANNALSVVSRTAASRKPLVVQTVAQCLGIAVVVWMVFCTYLAFVDTDQEHPRQIRIRQLHGVIATADHALTESARMAAATGDPQWSKRYHELEVKLDAAINETANLSSGPHMLSAAAALAAAKVRLVAMETRAFELIDSGRRDEAMDVLFSPEYAGRKRLYAESMKLLEKNMLGALGESMAKERSQAVFHMLLGAAVVPIMILAWIVSVRSAVKWRRALIRSNSDLTELTNSLDSQVAERTSKLAENNRCLRQEVAERKLAEERLSLSARVFESSGECIVITDAENRIVSANPAFREMTGFTVDEVVGQSPGILKSDRHDSEFYEAMWDSITTQGAWRGEIWNRRKNGEVFPQWLSINAVRDIDDRVVNYIAVSSDMTKRKAADERINFLAYYDALTELPNRALLQDRLQQAIANARRDRGELALMFLDLNRFKTINDSLGHHAGDLLLQKVAQRLKSRLRETDIVARMGGDEFVVVLSNLKNRGDVADIAREIHEEISKPMAIEGHALTVSTSIGVSLHPDDGADIQTLMKNADVAMYHCKEEGQQCVFFTSDMNDLASKRLAIENGLRGALAKDEFVLYYQPQWDLRTGRIIGSEALIRWEHPVLGIVPPMDFIPIAEESELIVPIGTWVLREACRMNAQWQHQGLPRVPVAVNVSAEQFRKTDFKTTVMEALADYDLAAEYLELEITETVLIHDPEAVARSFEEIRSIGVNFAIDDFGTGYSSLSYLKELSLSKLKIDRSFVRGVPQNKDDAAIVRAIVDMARSLSLRVIAEGVETQEHAEFLQSIRCDQAQGYLYSRPIPADEFGELLANERLGTHAIPVA